MNFAADRVYGDHLLPQKFANGAAQTSKEMAEREIVSSGRIQFDEDGEPVGFEEQKFRRDGASIAPLTPGEGPPADGASEEPQEGEQEPAPAAGEGGGPTARRLSDLLS
eukprot:COSAG04_NODE_8615_length_947_cov_1.155112_1_plen_108_part_10